ncbi:MAG: FtsQ-type POTRA domain-containing protein [Selenomonadaceae bacterium]|nr:FtsQ-type POTRA domain-containing protein [Selenomonadaceae bacterium]MBR0283801.1 FtsQ-type POTRA domain-containing protein [Selenomonadaceae bacterium]
METEKRVEKRIIKRRSPRRILKGFLFIVICTAIVGILVYSPIFVLRHVQVDGAVYLKKEELVRISGIYMGEPLFQLETDQVTKRLLQDLRIEEALVRRQLPSTLEITIKERMPVATVACEYGYLDIDRQGKVIDSYRTLKNMPIPMITGVQVRDLYIGDDVKDEMVKKILSFLQQLDDASLNQLSEIAITGPDYLVAYTTNSVQIRLGKLERMEEKARLTQDFLKDLATNPYQVEYVDFNYTTPFIKLIQ